MKHLQLPNFYDSSIISKDDKDLRIRTAKKLMSHYWSDYFVVWINSKETYAEINYQLSFKNKEHCIILQTEEDWFYDFDVEAMRRRIRNCVNWTPQSFIITNSKLDYITSCKLIKAKFKPGLLDLISFYPYDLNSITIKTEDIKYHTSFLYFAERPGRNLIFNMLRKDYIEKISVIKQGKDFVSNLDTEVSIFKDRANSPHCDIENDFAYSRFSSFLISFENFNGLECNTIVQKYSPTLSEKTYKAIHLLRPALIFGGFKTKEYLEELGFDTWDWLIDWSYDEEVDPSERFKKYLIELKRLLDIDINLIKNILDKNQDKLYNNRNRLEYLIKNYDKDLF